MLNEKQIIDIIISKLAPRGNNRQKNDDVSILSLRSLPMKGMKSLILKCDMLVESTDVPPGMNPWQIARKSISACVSDLSAKGIKPRVSLISVGIPKKYSKTDIGELAKGFQIASKEFDVMIVGGDTNESKELNNRLQHVRVFRGLRIRDFQAETVQNLVTWWWFLETLGMPLLV